MLRGYLANEIAIHVVKTAALVLTSMFVFGATVGYLVGLSKSPVVGIVLPVLFSVVGGTSGLYFARVDTSSPVERTNLVTVSLAVLALSVGIVGGTRTGLSERAGAPGWSMLSLSEERPFPPDDASGEGAIEWILLDARLHLLGLSPSDRIEVISRIERDAPANSVAPSAAQLDNEIEWLVTNFKRIIPSETEVTNHGEWSIVLEELRRLQAAHHSSIGIAAGTVAESSAALAVHSTFLSDDPDDQAYLNSDEAIRRIHSEFVSRVANLENVMATRSASTVRVANDRLEEFLSGNGKRLELRPLGRSLASVEGREPSG